MVVLPPVPPRPVSEADAEKGKQQMFEDNLDRHVEEVLRKRDKFRRVMRGVWSFLKTREFSVPCAKRATLTCLLTAMGVSMFLFHSDRKSVV